jgi:hypothetical protein
VFAYVYWQHGGAGCLWGNSLSKCWLLLEVDRDSNIMTVLAAGEKSGEH